MARSGTPVGPDAPAGRPGAPAAGGWPAFGGWQGGSLGAIDHGGDPSFGPAMTPAPKAATFRSGRASRSAAARAAGDEGGPPWAPAPEPGRTIGPRPMAPGGLFAPDPGLGIRVPGDMTGLPATPPESPPPGFGFIASPPAPDLISPPPVTQQSADFAAAPVPLDYAPPAGFSSLWDLAATDVFPAVSEPDPTGTDVGDGEAPVA